MFVRAFFCIFVLLILSACENTQKAPLALDSQKADLKKITESLKQNGNVQSATMIDQQIAGLDAKDEKSFLSLAESLQAAGKNPEAIGVLKTAHSLLPGSEPVKLKLAKAYVDSSEPAPALKILEVVKNQQTTEYYNLFGIAHDMQEKHLPAQEAYNKGLVIDGLDENLRNNLAMSYLLTDKTADAIKILEELVKSPYTKTKNLPKYRQNLALAYGISGKNDKAYKFLAKDLPQGQIQQNLGFYKAYRKQSVR